MRLNHLASVLALVGVLVAAVAVPQPATAQVQGAVVTEQGRLAIRHEKFRLENGFEVILVEDHRLPLVAFNLWVHAGPRNEAKGQTGFAHLFEHLMFAGSKHVPRGQFDKFVDAAGGTDSNGSTNFDRTNYFFTLPSHQLALGLWLKSDMLGYMLDEVDAVALANQQDVVRNERRQTTENRPYGVADEALYAALFPEGHPYRAAIIGSHADIQSIKLSDVRDFARTYYRPNNATLVLAGDFDPAEAKALVTTYFGPLKAGPKPPEVQVPQPVIQSERRLVVTDRIELPRLTLAWHTPAYAAAGDAELDVVSHVLGGGKASRLYGLLVRDKQLAQSVQVVQDSASLGSLFNVEVIARPGAKLDDIEALVDAEIARLAAEPPTEAEVARARAAVETQLLQRMEKVATLADLVNFYNQMAGDPGFATQDLARYRSITPQQVSAAAARWLRKDARVSLHTVPGEKLLAADVPTPPPPRKAAKGVGINDAAAWRAKPPAAAAAKPLALPAVRSFQLANGLTVLHAPKPGLPLVSASLVLRAGQSANPIDKPGLASFTAGMLTEGTTTRTGQQLAEALAALGAQLHAEAGAESARIDLNCLRAQVGLGLELLADVLLRPAFDAAEFERQRGQRLAALSQQREDGPTLAQNAAARALYGAAHPLGTAAIGTEVSLKALDVASLRAFWQSHYRPDRAALVVAGDIDETELRAMAERLLGSWTAASDSAAQTALPTPQPLAARTVLVHQAGAAQTALAVVSPGPRAGAPDTAAIKVMNAALGGLFTSRINQQLREVRGYTYGIYSGFQMGRERGSFGLYGSVRSDVVGAALKDIDREMVAIRKTPMGTAELGRVRNAVMLALPGQFDTNAAVVQGYANQWVIGQPIEALRALPAQLGSVNAADALRAARQHLDPARLTVIAVGDRAQIGPQLKGARGAVLELGPEGEP